MNYNHSMEKLKKILVRQQDQSDCGVACLLSIIHYYGGESKLEILRELSGTSKIGTTLLGLLQASQKIGFNSQGFSADIDNLKKIESPVILHVLIDERLQHFVICFGLDNSKFIIGDPSKGILEYSENELDLIWKSKALLQIKPTDNFKKVKSIKKEKRDWIIKLIQSDLNIIIMSVVLGLVVSILGQSTAIFAQKLIDDILPSAKIEKLVYALILVTFMLLIRQLISVMRQKFLLKQSIDFNNRIIGFFFKLLLYLPKSFFDHRKTGDLIARLNDTSKIQNTISFITGNVVTDSLAVIISIIFVLTYSVSCGIMLSVLIPLYFIIIFRFNKPVIDAQKYVMVAYAQTESHYVDTIQGISVIKESGKEDFFSKLNEFVYGNYQKQNNYLGQVQIKLNYWAELSGILIIVGLFSLTSYLVIEGSLKIGEMMAIISISGLAIPAIGRLALVNIQIQAAKIAFDRMYDFISVKPEYEEYIVEENLTTGKIEIEKITSLKVSNLAFRFPGRKQILSNIQFEVHRGELISILGENGSGKSTILQIIQKLYEQESGDLFINEINYTQLSIPELRKLIGVVPQNIKIFNGSLFDNICLGTTDQDYNAVISFCKNFGFNFYFERFPQGYHTLLGEEGINLSGGQVQLVALARALFRKPKILLLDESTSAMDRFTESFVMKLLYELKREMPIVIVTHRLYVAKQTNRIYVVENGNTKLFGTHTDLMKSVNVYSQWWKEIYL